MIRNLFKKYKRVAAYLFFGVCTTLVNIAAYFVSTRFLHIGILISTALAWFLAVMFAYATNRKYVFESQNEAKKAVLIEFASFISCRLITGAIDLGMMYCFVDLLKLNDLIVKIAANLFVIISNYIASKLIIFTKHGSGKSIQKDIADV